MRKKISVVVPCYNEVEVLRLFYEELKKTRYLLSHYDFECIFIDDGSQDDTLGVIKDFANNDAEVLFISFSRNFGKESAIYAGLSRAEGDYVAIMDADLQDPPALLPEMVSILETDEYDCVATRRADRKGEPIIRSWFAKEFYLIINKLSETTIVDGARDYRLMNRKFVEAIIAMSEHNRFSKGMFGWVGFRTYWISYENVERAAGKSKWSFWELARYAIEGITSFSQVPMRAIAYLGTSLSGLSFMALVFIIVRKLLIDDPVAGWTSTICIIIFIGGVQLAVLGLLGEYMTKVFIETKNRPHYIIAESNCSRCVKND